MVLVSFGSPTSVSSYIMAKNMHGDHELAGQILLLTTVCSLITVFAFIPVLLQHFRYAEVSVRAKPLQYRFFLHIIYRLF